MNIEDLIKTKAKLSNSKKAIINLTYTSNILNDQVNAELKAYDISIQQFNVLRILKGQNGKPANLSTIQERMINKMSNTTRLVDKLIKKDLVQRNTCPTNRRKVEINITAQGNKFLDTVNPVIENFENKTTSNLTQEELVTFNNLLNKLRNS